jgi:hypothetical protein
MKSRPTNVRFLVSSGMQAPGYLSVPQFDEIVRAGSHQKTKLRFLRVSYKLEYYRLHGHLGS